MTHFSEHIPVIKQLMTVLHMIKPPRSQYLSCTTFDLPVFLKHYHLSFSWNRSMCLDAKNVNVLIFYGRSTVTLALGI